MNERGPEEPVEPEPGSDRPEGTRPEPTMEWDAEAERVLASLVEMVPATVKQLAEASASDESELVASERGAEAVEPADVIRGWIRTTPPEQRDSLVEVIDGLGFDPQLFAEDLGSAEGWGEEEA